MSIIKLINPTIPSMKKHYLFLVALIISITSFGQTAITTIDHTNGNGPTTTATVANMTAIGMTRTGVVLDGTSGTGSFASRVWETSTTLNTNKYIQWSITANNSFNISATGLDIRYRRTNNQAPRKIQMFYSLDGFNATGPNPLGFPLNSVQEYNTPDNEQKTLNLSLNNINSGTSGGITFRLYGWDAINDGGTLAIELNSAWAGTLGIANPGIRIRGSVNEKLIYSNGVWTPFAPSDTTGLLNVLIMDGNYIPAQNISINSLTVKPNGNITILSNITVTCNTTSLESNSTDYSSLILDGTLNGTVTYKRHVNTGAVNGVGGNDLISAPLSGQTFGAFTTANTNIVSDPNNNNRKLFGPFNKSTGTYQIYDVAVDGGNALSSGIGYRAASTDGNGFTFTGTVNKNIVLNNIVNSGPQFSVWNLIGNPYSSYINVRQFLEYDVEASAEVVRNIDLMVENNAAIYGYDGNAANGWVVYNLNTPTTVNMAPGQGFFVTANSARVAPYDIVFAPSMRRIDTTDDFIAGRLADENNAHLKLQAFIGSSTYSTDFYFNNNSTSGLDWGYDAAVFGNNSPATAIYSHLAQNNTGVDMAIQSLAYEALTSDMMIPVGINVPQGQQVTVSIAESNLPSNINVFLEDNVSGAITLLNANDYVFTANINLKDTGRFFLQFSDQTLSTPETSINGLQIFAAATTKALFIKGQLSSATTVDLYDIQGRLVLSSNLEGSSNSNQVDLSSLATGVYIVKLNNATQQKTQKVILK